MVAGAAISRRLKIIFSGDDQLSDKLLNIFYQSHTGSWAILVVLFLVSLLLIKLGKAKGGRIVQMVVRLFYIIMLVSGIGMLIGYDFPAIYIVKGILAIGLIGAMEVVLGRAKRRESVAVPLIIVVVLVAIVALMGFGVISF